MSFANLKKNAKNSVEQIQEQLSKFNTSTFEDDSDQYWKPTVDKSGNGYAVIRFMPAPDGEDAPLIRYWDHSFQRNGKWYIERSLTTFGKDVKDPCGEYNSKLWGSGLGENRELVSGNPAKDIIGSKRRLHYVTNILVIDDPAKPENNGKVFKYSFGAKIKEMLDLAANPQFPDQQPINPFCFWNGANFKLRIRKSSANNQRDYSSSVFDNQSALYDGDEERLEALYSQLYSLAHELDCESNKKWKTYEELQKRLDYVLGNAVATPNTEKADSLPSTPARSTKTAAPKAQPESSTPEVGLPWDEDESDDAFKRFLADDND